MSARHLHPFLPGIGGHCIVCTWGPDSPSHVANEAEKQAVLALGEEPWDPREVACPTCEQPVGRPCRAASGGRSQPHVARRKARDVARSTWRAQRSDIRQRLGGPWRD